MPSSFWRSTQPWSTWAGPDFSGSTSFSLCRGVGRSPDGQLTEGGGILPPRRAKPVTVGRSRAYLPRLRLRRRMRPQRHDQGDRVDEDRGQKGELIERQG